jgi:hypothetical protein
VRKLTVVCGADQLALVVVLYKVGQCVRWRVFALNGFVFAMFFEWFFIEFIVFLHLIKEAVLVFVGH